MLAIRETPGLHMVHSKLGKLKQSDGPPGPVMLPEAVTSPQQERRWKMYRPNTPSLAFEVNVSDGEQMKRQRLGYRTKVKGLIKSFRDAAIMIGMLADATNYRYDDLCEIYMGSIEDGNTADEAWEELRDISLEYDW